MSTERPPALPPSLPGMGNINTIHVSPPITASPPITVSPPITQNPISTVHNVPHTVHNVQLNTCTSQCAATRAHANPDDDAFMYDDDHNHARHATEPQNDLHRAGGGGTSMSPHGLQQQSNNPPQQHDVLDRVPTPAQPIGKTYASVPPFPPSARAMLLRADAAVPESDDTAFALKWITIRVNMRADTSKYKGLALPVTPSNNLTTLRRVMFRAAELTGVTFSPRDVMQGLQLGRVGMRVMTKDDIAQHTQTHAAATEGGASAGDGLDPTLSSLSRSLSPSTPETIPTHQFVLRFDSNSNCKKGYQLLKQLQLSPRVPSPRYITGKVYGFPFTASNAEIDHHMQQNAWYEGCAPSIVITRNMQHAQHMFGNEQARDDCYFAVLASEFGKALHIPRLNSTRPLYFDKYERSKTTVCYHCNRAGHTSNACAARARNNAVDGIRDACIMCGSFDHISKTCPMRDDPAAMCIVCNKGKHTVRACPMYRGTYAKVTCPIQPHAHNRSTRHMRWAAVVNKQTQQQQQHAQQQQQVQQTRQKTQQQRLHPQPRAQDQQEQQALQTMKEENRGLREQIATLLTTQAAMAKQLQMLTETLTTFMAHMQTQVTANNKNIPLMIAHVPATENTNTQAQVPVPVSVAGTQPLSKHALTAANKAKAIAAVKGTPSLTSLWQPSVTTPVAKATHTRDDDDPTPTQDDTRTDDENVSQRMAEEVLDDADGYTTVPARKKSKAKKNNKTAATDKTTLNSQGKRPRSDSTQDEQ